MLQKLEMRKFITMVLVIAFAVTLPLIIILLYFFDVENTELLIAVLSAFTGPVTLVIGFYFGKSTALDEPGKNKDKREDEKNHE